jgi:hypothetical protein
MKKITSAALLAIQLTWKTALLVFALTLGLQIFEGFRELMPGGVPLQTTFAFEELLRSTVQAAGKWWAVMLMAFLISASGSSKGSKTVYTMNRLGLSEIQVTLVFGAVFSGYFLLYWALQIAVCYGFFVWYARFTLVGSNAWMLSCWRSEWLHFLLPLGEWWGYLRNLVICLSFGCSAAFASQQGRRGKIPLTWFIAPLLCVFLLSGRIGSIGMDMVLTVLLIAFTVGYFFALKGGREDEDL